MPCRRTWRQATRHLWHDRHQDITSADYPRDTTTSDFAPYNLTSGARHRSDRPTHSRSSAPTTSSASNHRPEPAGPFPGGEACVSAWLAFTANALRSGPAAATADCWWEGAGGASGDGELSRSYPFFLDDSDDPESWLASSWSSMPWTRSSPPPTPHAGPAGTAHRQAQHACGSATTGAGLWPRQPAGSAGGAAWRLHCK